MHPDMFIYIMHDGTATKVGVGREPTKRLASLQGGNPRLIKLLYVSIPLNTLTAYFVESRVHHRIGERRRLQGEWFDVEPSFAKACVEDEIARKIFNVRVRTPIYNSFSLL